jgi:hypothetical protein
MPKHENLDCLAGVAHRVVEVVLSPSQEKPTSGRDRGVMDCLAHFGKVGKQMERVVKIVCEGGRCLLAILEPPSGRLADLATGPPRYADLVAHLAA